MNHACASERHRTGRRRGTARCGDRLRERFGPIPAVAGGDGAGEGAGAAGATPTSVGDGGFAIGGRMGLGAGAAAAAAGEPPATPAPGTGLGVGDGGRGAGAPPPTCGNDGGRAGGLMGALGGGAARSDDGPSCGIENALIAGCAGMGPSTGSRSAARRGAPPLESTFSIPSFKLLAIWRYTPRNCWA